MIVGAMSAAPTPCTKRAATSITGDVARPQATDAAPNTHSPVSSSRRRPSTIPEPAAQQQQRPERERVARHDPLQAGGAEAELLCDRPQRDVDDAEVELEDELRDAERQQRRRGSGGQLALGTRDMSAVHGRSATTRLPRSMTTAGWRPPRSHRVRASTATRARRPTPRTRARERSSAPSSAGCTRSATASSGTRTPTDARRPARTSRLPPRPGGADVKTWRASSAVPSSPGRSPATQASPPPSTGSSSFRAAPTDPDGRRRPHLRIRPDRTVAVVQHAAGGERPGTVRPDRRPRRRVPRRRGGVLSHAQASSGASLASSAERGGRRPRGRPPRRRASRRAAGSTAPGSAPRVRGSRRRPP